MSYLEKITKLLNKRYWTDIFTNVILTPVSNKLTFLKTKIDELYCNFFFDSLNEDGCNYFENLLKISPEGGDSIENRRAKIQAHWLSNNHNSLSLVQAICSSWNDGEAEADFINGKIQLKFKTIGTPANLNSLLEAIGIVKPAHIPVLTLFSYLIIETIHEVKTIEEMEELTIDMFEF